MRRIEVPCTVDIAQTPESLHAHVTPDGIEIRPGDRVLVHGAPCGIGYGQQVSLRCTATVIRANVFTRFWTHVTSFLEFTALYEVGFERRESP